MKQLPFTHLLLALLIVMIWGVNFIAIEIALQEVPPIMLCAMRFILASIPAVFFIKLPTHTPFKLVAWYGLIMFALQFLFVFTGLNLGMTAGMASLTLQLQVFFSMFFTAIFLGESPTIWQLSGAIIAFSGIGLVGVHLDNHITIPGFLCVLAGAATWGVGNFLAKKTSNANVFSLVAWGNLVASVPMIILTLIIHGPTVVAYTFLHMSWITVYALLYIVFASTWMGYSAWSWLLRHHPIATIGPFTLLVPIIAMGTSVLFLHESFALWKLESAVLVLTGLIINLFGPELFYRLSGATTA